MDILSTTPYSLLGISRDASADEIRQAYLEKVRLHPPDRDPDTFRQVHDAYQRLCDPLVYAKSLIDAYLRNPPDLKKLIDTMAATRCRLPVNLLLALGNQDQDTATHE